MTDTYTDAACRGCETELWFADSRHRADQLAAIDICKGCPIRQACLDDAIATGDAWGIRGGLTEAARRRLKSGRALKPHGTTAAYQRHLYRGEKPCDLCREAGCEASCERQRAYRAKRSAA